jgi:LysR family glycine cleavage system transcriptional activator
MPVRLPPLIALRAFEAVGRLGSVGAAAEELCVNHSVVSRHLANLQDRLGVELLVPRGRSIGLTEEGHAYHTRINRAFDAIARATAELKPAPVQLLDIRCIPGLANRGLLRHLGDLEARLPGVEIMLQPTLADPDLLGGEADAEIVFRDRDGNAGRNRQVGRAPGRLLPRRYHPPLGRRRYPGGARMVACALCVKPDRCLKGTNKVRTKRWCRLVAGAMVEADLPTQGSRNVQ